MSSKGETKEPNFGDVAIFYHYVFDLGKNVNPTEAGRELLNTHYAICLSNYVSKDIELAARFKGSFELRERAQSLADFSTHLSEQGLIKTVSWSLRHPKQSLGIWRLMLKKWREKAEDEVQQDDADLDNRDSDAILADAINAIDKQMSDAQLLLALQMFSDREIFSEIYLDEVPFTRLALQPFFATIDGKERSFETHLLIHRTGVGILTFHAVFEEQLSVADIIRLQIASRVTPTKMRIPDALIATQAIVYGAKPSAVNKAMEESGSQLYEFENQGEEKQALIDIFSWYRMTIASTVLGKDPANMDDFWKSFRTADWLSHPVVLIRSLPSTHPTEDAFKQHYQAPLAGILLRYENWKRLRKECVDEAVKGDLSITSDRSHYVGPSHTTVLYFGSYKKKLLDQFGPNIPGQEWLFDHFQSSVLTEVLLIQQWILHILDKELRRLPYSLRDLTSLKRSLTLALDEYHSITVRSGQFREILSHSRDAWGLNSIYSGLSAKLNNFEKLIDVEESLRRYRRDLLLRLVVVVGTLLYGLSGAKLVINVLVMWNPLPSNFTPEWLAKTVNSFLSFVSLHPNYSTLILYLILLAVVFPAMILSVWPVRRTKAIIPFDQSETAKVSNFSWPTKVEFKAREQKAVSIKKKQKGSSV